MMLDILHRHVARDMDGFPRISNCEYCNNTITHALCKMYEMYLSILQRARIILNSITVKNPIGIFFSKICLENSTDIVGIINT